MKACKSKMIAGMIGAALAFASASSAQAQSASVNEVGSGGSMSVRHAIQTFADRYGDIVIVHGVSNMDARIASDFEDGSSSAQAISVLSSAAGARAERVYFVTPAGGSSPVTTGAAARRLVNNTNPVEFRLMKVPAKAAILSVAAADNAEVRFPDGVPSGIVNLEATSMPIDRAISDVAAETQTHWRLGYILDSNNTSLPSMMASNGSSTSGSQQPDNSFVPQAGSTAPSAPNVTFSPGSSGDSSAAIAPQSPQATSGDSTAAGTDNTRQRVASALVPAGGLPSVVAVQGGKRIVLPAEAPLPRDANGNILPITIHLPPPAPATANGNNNNNFVLPTYGIDGFATQPGSNGTLPGSDGAVSVQDPNTNAGGANSALSFGSNSPAFGPNGYGGGFSTYPGYSWQSF